MRPERFSGRAAAPRRRGLRALLLVAAAASARANVYTYVDAELLPDQVQYRRVGMWAAADAPARGPPGDGSSSVSLDLAFKRPTGARAGLVQVLVFHSGELSRIGSADNAERIFCCTAALRAHGSPGCEQVGRLVVRPPAHGRDHFYAHDVAFHANQTAAALSQKVQVHRSGVHYLLLSSCEPKTGEVRFSGATTWRNPYGFLPGELYPFLPFYAATTLAYVVLALGWAFLCARHWSQLLPLQLAIAAVLALGIAEGAIWHTGYRHFNAGGTRGVVPVTAGVLTSTVRKTVSRLLVLTVSLGYGVVRPSLGSDAKRVGALGAVYFVCSAALDLVSNVSQISELSVPLRLLFILPVTLLDGLFYWWTFKALTRTLGQLSSRRQSAKLLLYRRFSHVLLGLIGVSAGWVAYQMRAIVADDLDGAWSSLWVFDCFWQLLYLVVLLAICLLWSPSKNNLQYAYMDELVDMDAQDADEERSEAAEKVALA